MLMAIFLAPVVLKTETGASRQYLYRRCALYCYIAYDYLARLLIMDVTIQLAPWR